MIPYVNRSFGIEILTRVHGSALYKSLLPALISTAIYLAIAFLTDDSAMEELFLHPYPMQALVTAFTFLLVFRANYSYNRWWEAYTAVYLMHSKWLDFAMEIAAFHYQSKRYDPYKPPSFGANPGVQSLDFLETNFVDWDSSTKSHINRNSEDTATSSIGVNVARVRASSVGGDGNVRTPPRSPLKQNLSPLRTPATPGARTRHAKQPTLTDLIHQMDAQEAKEEEEKRQSLMDAQEAREEEEKQQILIPEESQENEVEDNDNDDKFSEIGPDQNDCEFGQVREEITGQKEKSWLRRMRDRRSDAKAERKTRKAEKHCRARSIRFATAPEGSGNVNCAGHPKTNRTKQKVRRRRSRHQPATARLHSQRKTIRAWRREEQFESRDLVDSEGKEYTPFDTFKRKHLRDGKLDPDEVPPLLFLEECAHLLSLMSAVAFSTLRNDLPEAESPLASFDPGLPWPLVDPDGYKSKVRKGWTQSRSRFYTFLQFVLGRSRNIEARTRYNSSRPFRVIGYVSDAEIEKLQEARGPLAKVSLISMWLLELISREYQSGSTGDVASPILSRLYQYISEGLAGYNQARKIAYIPFPFPHAQITTLYLLVVDFFVTPLLMTTFVTDVTMGFFLNLFSVLCFTGLHEVAREIENPFLNVPNDVPLNNYQAQFNEGLLVMFYGYHPDAYWDRTQRGDFGDRPPSPPNTQNEFKSPRTEALSPSDLNRKILQIPRSPFSDNEPSSPPAEENDREGLTPTISNNRADVNRTSDLGRSIPSQPIFDMPSDAFLRGLVVNGRDTTSTTDSFRRMPKEDSFLRSTDNSRGLTPSPVSFRIPKTTNKNDEEKELPNTMKSD